MKISNILLGVLFLITVGTVLYPFVTCAEF